MKYNWYASKDGRQYWVTVDEQKGMIELSSDTNSPFAGGGYSEYLAEEKFRDKNFIQYMESIFGEEITGEMIAALLTVKALPGEKDKSGDELLKKRDIFFYEELERITKLRMDRLKSPGRPGPAGK